MRVKFDCTSRFDAENLAARTRLAGDRALWKTGELVRGRSAALVPRRSGALAASGRVERGAGRVVVRYDMPYAAIQHERSDFRHPNGGQAKYLRAVIEDSATAKTLADELARELRP